MDTHRTQSTGFLLSEIFAELEWRPVDLGMTASEFTAWGQPVTINRPARAANQTPNEVQGREAQRRPQRPAYSIPVLILRPSVSIRR